MTATSPDAITMGAVIEAPAGPHGWLSDAVRFGTAWAEAGDEARVFIELWQAVL